MGIFNLGKKLEPPSAVEVLEKRLEAMIDVNQAIAGVVKTDEVLDMITSKLVSVIGVSFAVVFTWDEVTQSLYLRSITVPKLILGLIERSIGRSIKTVSYSVKNSENLKNYYVKCLVENKTLKTESLYDLSYPTLGRAPTTIIQGLLGMKLSVVIPLVIRGQKLGVLGIIWKEKEISQVDESSVMAFANQVSTTIYNANLFTQVNNQVTALTAKNKELTSLYNLTSNMSKTLDPKRVSQAAVDSIPQDETMLGAMLGALDDKGYILTTVAVSRNKVAYEAEKLLGGFDKYKIDINSEAYRNNAFVKVLRAGAPYFTNDLAEAFSPPIPPALLVPLSALLGIKSIAIYPISFRGRTVGTITYLIKNKTREEIDQNQQQLLATYSTQIAISLENANLFNKSQVIQLNLENALKQLETLRKHERDMIDIMGHELRTPMSIVRNALVMMNELVKNDPNALPMDKLKKYTEIGLESARREVALIETLLSATKADGKGFQLMLEKVDMLDVINDSINAFTKECEKKGLYLKFTQPQEEMWVYADRTRVQEVSDNVLSNAVKYTMKGGVEIRMYKENGFVYVDYTDTGMGISEEDVKKLGGKFFRAKQYLEDDIQLQGIQSPIGEKLQIVRPGGTGLGLYVTFNLVKVLDGRINVKSKLRQGSTFTVGFPMFNNQPSQQVEKKMEAFQAQPATEMIVK